MPAMFILTATTWLARWRWGRWLVLRVLVRLLHDKHAIRRALYAPKGMVLGSRLRKGDVVAGQTESFLVDCRGLGYVLLAYDGILEAYVDPKKTYLLEVPTRKERELWEAMGLQVGSEP
jgi:hypothetical protein